jgi:hypothetical protein
MKSEDRCGDYLTAVVVIGSEFNVRALGIVIIFCVHQSKQHAQAPTSGTEGYWHEEVPDRERSGTSGREGCWRGASALSLTELMLHYCDTTVLAQTWQPANDKARELEWIGLPMFG